MARQIDRRRILQLGGSFSLLTLLAACDTMGFDLGARAPGLPARPEPAGRSFGTGSTRVALLLPLSGDPALASVGVSMANAAQLAMDYVSDSPKVGDNITLLLMDTGDSAAMAAQRASEAVSAGASLILGPLRGDQVVSAGDAARSGGVPLVGFSNTPSAASPGVYLLSVLPEVEVRRGLSYAATRGRRTAAGIFPNTSFGQAQQAAFQQVTTSLGIGMRATYTFGSDGEARSAMAQLAPRLGAIDLLFLPDRASAPGFGAMLQQAGKVTVVGSADWDGDPAIIAAPGLAGAIYPAVDSRGYQALSAEYASRFGGKPHPLATIAYTAVILANAGPLVRARYSAEALTMPGGFNGRDGVFRFLPDGRCDYALVIKQVQPGGAVQVDGPKL